MTTVTERRDSAGEPATLPSPAARIFRRPSDRFRRENPRKVRHHLSTRIAEIVSWVVWRMPNRLRDGLADRIGDVWVRLTPAYRANVIANLGQIYGPETPRRELEDRARHVFRMSARNFGELLRLRHLTAEQLKAALPMSITDVKVFADASARRQGVVIVTAHLGAFDLMGHAIAAQGFPMTAITGRTTSRYIFDAITHLRRGDGLTPVEPTPAGVRKVIQALRRGEVAAFVADYDFFQNGLPVTFFGRTTTLPPGAIRIARDTGSLIVPMFPSRCQHGHHLTVGEPFMVAKTKDMDADLALGMEVLKTRLEEGIGATPDQWVLFQRAWPWEPAPPVRVFPVGSPLESEFLQRVDAVLPPRRDDVNGVRRELGNS